MNYRTGEICEKKIETFITSENGTEKMAINGPNMIIIVQGAGYNTETRRGYKL